MKFFVQQIKLLLQSFADLIDIVLRTPVAIEQDVDEDAEEQPFWKRVLRFPVLLLRWITSRVLWFLLLPLRALRAVLLASPIDLLLGTPAIVVATAIAIISGRVILESDTISDRYRLAGQRALVAQEFTRASTLFGRLVSDTKSPSQEDLFSWGVSLAGMGDLDRANKVIDGLSPDDSVGYSKAHRLKAINVAQSLATQQKDPLILKKLRHHLERCNDKSSGEINNAWASYYLTVGDEENALKHLSIAASINPEYFLLMAEICKRTDNSAVAKRALREAHSVFQSLLDKDPLNTRARVFLARVLYEEGDLNDAEQVLLRGTELQPDDTIRRSTAEYYVLRHDVVVANKSDVSEQFGFLQKALRFDPNFPPVYERLIRLYRIKSQEDDGSSIRELLESTVASGATPALAHFALGNLKWIDGESKEAEWHIQQAYRLDSAFALIGNNLAWILAHKDEPDLETAFKLSKSVVELVPEDARFRDTYATVLMKQEKLQEAVVEFERALITIQEKKPLHEKLAAIYNQLGQTELADLHKKLAERAGEK